MRNPRIRVLGATVVALALLAAACGGDDASGGDTPKEGPTITIGSFGFAESEILGEIYKQALENAGYDVVHQALLGSREAVVNPGLESGQLDFVPEYVGSALEVTFGTSPTADTAATRQALEEAYAEEGFAVLEATPAQDKNGIVVRADTAEEYGLTTISDLEPVAGELVFGGPPECEQRPRCLLGLQETYGLDFAEFKALDTGGPLTVTALEGGEIDVALLFSSDGVIEAQGFVLLDDDRGLQPAENIVPVVRQSIVDAYGSEFVDLVNDVSAEISQEELISLNRLVGFEGETATAAAAGWLEENGF